MSKSRIFSEVDFAKDGKQCGFLRLPHSVHRSAYGWIGIPITCIKNGSGPTVLLVSGNHGDEYEGQVTLMKLTRKLNADDVKGRIIILSAANFPAAMAGMRTSPIDEGNLNRSFPGDPNGRPTAMIAHYIESVLLPMADFTVDLHSGGSSLMYIASSLARLSAEPAQRAKTIEMMRLFGTPVAFLLDMPQGEDRTLTGATERVGTGLHLGTELGGSGTVTPSVLAYAEAGVARLLNHFGVMRKPFETSAPGKTRILRVSGSSYYCYAPDGGLFEPYVDLGAEVKAGQAAGAVHYQDTPWREPTIAYFEHDGLVICKRIPGRIERGDCLFHLGTDYEGA
ncbi:MAG: succinylglutamate desuccinylase/aspartoacylase family protein, partial [Alphaproteobacteria bacterium]|nr:succinylglutamate desuccinylase/aspartoacylase family protein [Alphaproteobacteria bacterium]